MKHVYITSSRRNPEQNLKADRNKEIEKYFYLDEQYKRPHYFASFTDEFKLGINPHSRYSTPLAIYTYPIRYVAGYLKSSFFTKTALPFAGDKPYIQIGEITVGKDKILYFDKYPNSTYQNDIKKLENYYYTLNIDTSLVTSIDSYLYRKYHLDTRLNSSFSGIVDLAVELAESSLKYNKLRKIRNAHLIWCITQILSYFSGIEKSSIKWNFIFRKVLDYWVLEDDGLGIIHFHEKTQTAFLTKQAIKLVDVIDNKVHETRDLSPKTYDNDINKILKINPSLKSIIKDKTLKIEIEKNNTIKISGENIKDKTIKNVVLSDIAINKCNLEKCTIINKNKMVSYSTLNNSIVKNAKIGGCSISNSTVEDALVYDATIDNCIINNGAFKAFRKNLQITIKNSTINGGLFRKVTFENCNFTNDKNSESYSFEDCSWN